MPHDPQKWPAPTAEVITYFKSIPTPRGQSYRLAIWKVCLASFPNPSRCRWVELKLQPRSAKGKGKIKKIRITPLHLPWAKSELSSQTQALDFSKVKHTFPLYELMKACHTGRRGKPENGLTNVNAASTFLGEPTPTSNPALSNSPALKRKEKPLDPLAQLLSAGSSSAPSGAPPRNSVTH